MRIVTKADIQGKKKPTTITLTVDDPVTRRTIHRVVIDRSEAEESVEYLRSHNGSAPEFVHAFIDAMEVALSLRV